MSHVRACYRNKRPFANNKEKDALAEALRSGNAAGPRVLGGFLRTHGMQPEETYGMRVRQLLRWLKQQA